MTVERCSCCHVVGPIGLTQKVRINTNQYWWLCSRCIHQGCRFQSTGHDANPPNQIKTSSQSISLAEIKAFRKDRFDSSMAIIESKGHDYNAAQQNSGDTLFNLRVAEILGVVKTAEQGILTRITDKLMRLISLVKPGVQPKHESVMDTIDDMHNYLDYMALIWLRRQKGKKGSSPTMISYSDGDYGP